MSLFRQSPVSRSRWSVRPLGLFLFTVLLLLVSPAIHAQQKSDNYNSPRDVVSSGGGEESESANYKLSDTFGEPGIGASQSANYGLQAGYRQTLNTFISLSCVFPVDIGIIDGVGQSTGSGTCTVITDNDGGYSLSWSVTTGSGGTSTGYMINPEEEVIAPLTVAVPGTPETWSVASSDSRWGGRLSSVSTDTDSMWGTDASSEKWLNVGTGSTTTVVERGTRTDVAGSEEILEYRAEIGSAKVQAPGTYEVIVELVASML